MRDDAKAMKIAIERARAGVDAGQTPFGCSIYEGETLVAAAHNSVWRDCDPNAHAEVNAIRLAARVLKRIDLTGCVLYTTCEPCPMCLTACHWAKVDEVVFGATIEDAAEAGFKELFISAADMVKRGKSPLRVRRGPEQAQCISLFNYWKENGKSENY